VAILKRVLQIIKAAYPDIEIIVRADSGFSCPSFYLLADSFGLKYAIGQASNERIKRREAGLPRLFPCFMSQKTSNTSTFFRLTIKPGHGTAHNAVILK
jgi:hypothetical protein